MNNEKTFMTGCSEEFAELCALSTTGELSAEEIEVLEQHLSGCAPCRALLQEYTSLATVGMAKLAAVHEPVADPVSSYIASPQSDKQAEERFAAMLRAAQPAWHTGYPSRLHLVAASKNQNGRKRMAELLATAACLLLCVGGGIQIGRRMDLRPNPEPPAAVVSKPAVSPPQESPLEVELKAAQASLNAMSARSAGLEKTLKEITSTRASLSARVNVLTRQNDADATSLSAMSQQRDELQQQLNDVTASLVQAKEELDHARRDREGALMRVASLQLEINDLHTEVSATNRSAGDDEKFLAADRDIRELMGARQLYIADVFDVQNDGKRSKPFGRVFYTKGKSLIFYAFDLEKQPGYREAKAFQAWGKSDQASAKPISIGVFYMDNEQNRRWVVKSDNPEILAQINSVFVTVEPHGGSHKPTSKPFLEAYLHTLPPNHP